MGIKEKIREYANKIGLPLFGVTSPEPLDYLREFLDQRKSKGYDTVFEKGWTASRRCEVKQHFPGARSVICVGLPYYQQPRKGGDQKNKGYLSLYTRGVDYHRVLKHKLKGLALFVEGLVDGFEYMICVDTIPLVEKALAHRAGLGWQGKNSLLYSPHYGSWFFLGELITNLYLTPDTPIPNKCGGCNKCISSCPANAIKEHYILDAGKCISGVLQNPGIIPVEMRKKIGKNVFGCDICQVVCPHNQNISPVDNELKNNGDGNYDLLDLLYLTNREYRDKFAESALSWRGRKVLQRNAVVAIGNTGDKGFVPKLKDALNDRRPLIRIHTAWALGELGGDKSRDMLLKRKRIEDDVQVQEEIDMALKKHDFRQH